MLYRTFTNKAMSEITMTAVPKSVTLLCADMAFVFKQEGAGSFDQDPLHYQPENDCEIYSSAAGASFFTICQYSFPLTVVNPAARRAFSRFSFACLKAASAIVTSPVLL